MGSEQGNRLGELAARVPPAEFRVREVALVAIGIAEVVLAGLCDPIELVLRDVFGQPVARVFGEIELLQGRMPIHADDLADAMGVDFKALTIETDTVDLGVPLWRYADVAGRANLEAKLLVGAAGEVFPTVRLILRQIAQDDGWLRWVVEVVLDVLYLGDLVKLGNVECALVQGDTVRPVQAGGYDLHLALAVLLDNGVHLILHATRNEHRVFVSLPQRPSIGNAGGVDLDPEAGFDLQLVEGQLVRRGRQRRWENGRELGIGDARRLTLLPGRWRLRGLLCVDFRYGRGGQKPAQAK